MGDGLKNGPLYKLAYEESQRTLDDQADELTGIRGRAVQFVAFVGAATAFLVGTSLQTVERDVTFYWLAGIATSMSVLLFVLIIAVLVPWKNWEYRLSARALIRGWIEAEVPPPNEAAFLRALAQRYDDMRVNNERVLRPLRRCYVGIIAVGLSQLTLWAALAWWRA